MAQPQIFEGTAEEIATQLRGRNLKGRLKAIVTPEEPLAQNGNTPNLGVTLAEFLAEVDKAEFTPGKPHTDPHENAFGEIMTEKYRRMGFKV